MLKFKDDNLLMFLQLLNKILINHPNSLQDYHFDSIDLALTRLNGLIETNSYNTNIDIKINIELSKLTMGLKDYFVKRNINVPQSIMQWEKIFTDENQLSYYRTIWG